MSNNFEIEFKNVEFEIAHYGIITLQTVLPLLLQAGLDTALIVEKLAIAPRNLLKLEVPQIAVGQAANFTAFNPTQEWRFDSETNQSKSANSPLFNTMLKGKVTLVYNNKQYRVF